MFKKSTVFILHIAPNLLFALSLQSACYTQSAFYPWSAVCSPQSSFYTDRLQIIVSLLTQARQMTEENRLFLLSLNSALEL